MKVPNNKKNYLLTLALKQKIWFLKKNTELMKNKTLLKDCKCVHCLQKLEQINSSRLYWDKIILSKNTN
tara:strand:+ start:232 stop:438 length:207 start_codon:yes stop_codon:yes gene_type:complete